MFNQMNQIMMLGQEDATPAALPGPSGVDEAKTVEPGSKPLGPDGSGGGAAPPPQGLGGILPLLLVVMVVMIVFSMSGQRKEKKKRAEMLGSLKKGVKVQTVGGIIGTVVEVRDSDVVLKIDENSNTRIKFTRGSIQSLAEDQDQEG